MLKNILCFVLALALPAGAALAAGQGMEGIAGDAAKGEKVFKKCKACHDVGPEAKNKVGPNLTGVVGRHIAIEEGFSYSDAMTALGEKDGTWTPEELSAFLTKPRDFVKGTKMSFVGLSKDEDRADVIAYLATFSMEGN